MRRCVPAILVAFLVIGFSCLAVAAEPVTVCVNDELLTFDVSPALVDGRALVPFRTILEALGARVDWDHESRTVTAVRGSDTVSLTVGQKTAYKNGQAVELDVPPTISDGRTLVPVRFVSQALGAEVEWVAATRTVYIRDLKAPGLYEELGRLISEVDALLEKDPEDARLAVISGSGVWRQLINTRSSWIADLGLNADSISSLDLHAIWFPEGEAKRFLARLINRPFSLDQAPYEIKDPPIVDLVIFIDLRDEPLLVWLGALAQGGEAAIPLGTDPVDAAVKAYMEKWQGPGWGYGLTKGEKPDLAGIELQGYRPGPGYWFPVD